MPHDNAALMREAAETLVGEWAIRMARASRDGIPDAIAQAEVDAAKPIRDLATRLRAAADALAAGGEAMVSRYTIGNVDDRDTMHRVIQVEYTGRGKWAVRRLGDCLNRDGEWEWEPLPSSRDDAFLTRCRYDNAPEAINAARRAEEPRHD